MEKNDIQVELKSDYKISSVIDTKSVSLNLPIIFDKCHHRICSECVSIKNSNSFMSFCSICEVIIFNT